MSTKVAIATEVAKCVIIRFKGNSDKLIWELRAHLVIADFHKEWDLSFFERQNSLYIFSLSKDMTVFNKVRAWLEGEGCDVVVAHSLEP